MRKIHLKQCVTITMVAVLTGCASSNEIRSLKVQVVELKSQMSKISADSDKALRAANAAAASAEQIKMNAAAAELSANQAARFSKDSNKKLKELYDSLMNYKP